MNTDEWGEVINGLDTYTTIAKKLLNHKPVLIGWTDGRGTHFDILFTLGADRTGTIQGGIRDTDLFVSLMRVGAFGFDPSDDAIHQSYYDEKLTRGGFLGSTASPLAELIDGVKQYLN